MWERCGKKENEEGCECQVGKEKEKNKEKDSREGKRLKKYVKGGGEMRKEGKWRKV